MVLQRIILVAGVMMALVLGSVAAQAATSRVCRDLEAQLASAGKGGGNTAQARKWSDAAARQRQEIAKLKSRCGTSFFGGDQGCRAKLNQMQRNLAGLERKAAELGGGKAGNRAAIQAAMRRNGCGAERQDDILAEKRRETRSIISQIFGGGIGRTTLDPDANRKTIRATLQGDANSVTLGGTGTYRTLCVRTCDGYFFPVSFSTRREMFDRDQAACEAACPGTEAKLYVHEVPEQESEDMVSLDGKPYTALPNAFRYQEAGYKRTDQCSCGAAKNFTIIAGLPKPEDPAETQAEAPLPPVRADQASDIETERDAAGGLDAAAIAALLRPGPADVASAERRIRVVGPEFLPDPEGAIDLRSPGLKTVQ